VSKVLEKCNAIRVTQALLNLSYGGWWPVIEQILWPQLLSQSVERQIYWRSGLIAVAMEGPIEISDHNIMSW